jgi:hypothetical protein
VHARDIPFCHKDNHIRCFPHVTNICSTHVIEAFTNTALVDDSGGFIASAAYPPSDPDSQTYEEAVARDPIALCRSTVRAIRVSGERRDHLADIIRDGNDKGWFKAPEDPTQTIQVKALQLVRDMKVRWDSLYYMINRFRKLRPVCQPHSLFMMCILIHHKKIRPLSISFLLLSTGSLQNFR